MPPELVDLDALRSIPDTRKRARSCGRPIIVLKEEMWIVLTPAPRPDAPEWPGRRWLAAADALAWPAAWAVGAAMALRSTGGLVWPVVIALAACAALSRSYRAVWMNHRYRFTTWRWGKLAGALFLIGFVLKLTVAR